MADFVFRVWLNAAMTTYSGFVTPGVTVEAIVDKGPIAELIVRCQIGTAIVSYSKMERSYCTLRLKCHASLESVLAETCR